jgi:hypothetical protein
MTEAQKELISIWAMEYFNTCISYEQSEKWKQGFLEIIENAQRIKECLE